MRLTALPAAAAVGLLALSPAAAHAVTLPEAIAQALAHDPGLKQAQARREAARARLRQAQAGRLPNVSVSGSAAESAANFHHFFGFGSYNLQPRQAVLDIRQPLFAGGGLGAAVDQARAGDESAQLSVENTRLSLVAEVAQAYVGVQVAERTLQLRAATRDDLAVTLAQAQKRFAAGEVPRTDVDQAQARLSEAKTSVISAQGDLEVARARYRTLTGEEPVGLQPAREVPPTPATLSDAVAEAQSESPAVQSAEAAVRAADAGVRKARAERAPSLALTAQASTIRDEFFPGYRADAASIGVEGRWTLFSSGLVGGKISEARADRRAADAALAQARSSVEEQVIDAWQSRQTAELSVQAAADQAKAAQAALDSVRNEVRVGEKPTLDLLNAQQEALSADIAVLRSEGLRVISAYRLNALIGREPGR